jgi:hypothetical protein
VVLTKPRIRGKFDATCKLAVGEHAFIEEESYIAYFHINQFSQAVLEKQLANGVIHSNEAVSPLLTRICNGILVSRHCPPIEKNTIRSV